MKETAYTTRVLHAEEGFMLTQAAEVPVTKRVVSDTVYLGTTDSPDNWREVTAEEGERIRAARLDAE